MRGNIFMVYHMGQDAIPIATLDTKVNDGKYHRVKFVRNGANAMLQVDWEKEYKNPVGKLIFPSYYFLQICLCCSFQHTVGS